MEKYIHVITSTERKEDAERIAGILVEKRLAACVQIIGPVTSIYWWKGKIEKAQEWLCLAKSVESLYGEIESAIRDAHPYETPEIIATPILKGEKDYIEWIENELKIT